MISSLGRTDPRSQGPAPHAVTHLARRRPAASAPQAGLHRQSIEKTSLISFVYNIGLGNFDISSVKRDLSAAPPDYSAVPADMRKFVKSGGAFLCGLYKRRVNEGHLFETGSYAIASPACP